MGTLLALEGAVAQGLLYAIMTLGVYITYKLLDFADLTVDGSFALGGCVSAILITVGLDPFTSLLIATLAGMASGVITGFFNTVFKIPPILSGILTMLALYSINLRVMLGKANVPLGQDETIFTIIQKWIPIQTDLLVILIGLVIVILVIAFMYWFFGTEVGSAIRATGNNPDMIRALGVNTSWMKIIALLFSNGLAALSDALITQYQQNASVTNGTGMIVVGLASVIIGEVIFGNRFNFIYKLSSVVIGSLIYRIVVALVLQVGLDTQDLKLFTAVFVALALAVPVFKQRIQRLSNRTGKPKKQQDSNESEQGGAPNDSTQ